MIGIPLLYYILEVVVEDAGSDGKINLLKCVMLH